MDLSRDPCDTWDHRHVDCRLWAQARNAPGLLLSRGCRALLGFREDAHIDDWHYLEYRVQFTSFLG